MMKRLGQVPLLRSGKSHRTGEPVINNGSGTHRWPMRTLDHVREAPELFVSRVPEPDNSLQLSIGPATSDE
jgi:hypothetical protein